METSDCEFDTLESASVDDDDWLMYGERAGWSDVEPVPQDEGDGGPVVCIAYSARFVDVYDRVRAVLASGEASRRVLRLLSAAIELNPANYTAWQARRGVLERLLHPAAAADAAAADAGSASAARVCPGPLRLLDAELYFSRKMIESNPKNYQVWHHRCWAVEQLVALHSAEELGDGTQTTTTADSSTDKYSHKSNRVAVSDSANIDAEDVQLKRDPDVIDSAASTSEAVLSDANGEPVTAAPGDRVSSEDARVDYTVGVGRRELRLTELALSADAKNFHVWQYRQWVLQRFGLWSLELPFVDRLLDEDVLNNSAWNQRYRALLAARDGQEQGADVGRGSLSASAVEDELEYCLRRLRCEWENEAAWNYVRGVAVHAGTGLSGCRQLQQMVRERLGEREGEGCGRHAIGFLVDALLERGDTEALTEARTLIQLLAERYDPIRKRYWLYRLAEVGSMAA